MDAMANLQSKLIFKRRNFHTSMKPEKLNNLLIKTFNFKNECKYN